MAVDPADIIVNGDFEVYVAPVGEAFPKINEDPGGNWEALVKKSRITEDGLTVEHDQTIDEHMVSGQTGAIKATRSQEALRISFTSVSLSLENYSKILNGNDVATVASASGVAGERSLPILQGQDVKQFALLVKMPNSSPYGTDFPLQYEIPRVIQTASPSVQYTRSGMAGLSVVFSAMQDETSGFGVLRVQDEAAGD